MNSLNNPTINGLRSLTLDEITTADLNADNIYLSNVETSDLIIDNQITMLNGSVINAKSAIISDNEISFLDGVNSNIQSQINTHTTDILTNTVDISTNTVNILTNTVDISEMSLQTVYNVDNQIITSLNKEITVTGFNNIKNSDILFKCQNDNNIVVFSVNAGGEIRLQQLEFADVTTQNTASHVDDYETRISNLEFDTQDIEYDFDETIITSPTTTIWNLFVTTSCSLSLISFPTSLESQYYPYTNSERQLLLDISANGLVDTTLINSSNKLDASLIGAGNTDNNNFQYISTTTSNVQDQTNNLQTQITTNTVDISDMGLPRLFTHVDFGYYFQGSRHFSDNTWYEHTATWDPMSVGSLKLDVGYYHINLMVNAKNMSDFERCTSQIVIWDTDGAGSEEEKSWIMGESRDTATNILPVFYYNVQYYYNCTEANRYKVIIYNDYHVKSGTDCTISAKMQFIRMNGFNT